MMSPVTAVIARMRSVQTRPNRSTTGPPSARPAVIATENTVSAMAPWASVPLCPSTTASGSQSFAPPSANAMPSMMTPIA